MAPQDQNAGAMDWIAARVLWRSFFLETLWNHDKMQNIGFLFCLYPALERFYPGREELKRATERHLSLVNTHPCMGPLLVGLTARLERDFDPAKVITYRHRLMAALAAHGDRIFWHNIRPLAAIAGTVVCVSCFGSFAGSVVLLVMYNSLQLFARASGFYIGWKDGLDILRKLTSPKIQLAVQLMRRCTALGLGVLFGLVLIASMQTDPSAQWSQFRPMNALCLAGLAAAAWLALKRHMTLTAVVYPATVLATILFALL